MNRVQPVRELLQQTCSDYADEYFDNLKSNGCETVFALKCMSC